MFWRPRPSRVTTPLLVVGGEEDRILTPTEMERTAKAYGGQPVMIPGAAHDLMLDQRWQQAADAILGWLNDRGL